MTSATFESNRNRTGRIAMLVGCVLAGSLGVSQAATAFGEPPAVVVSYSDLDLSTTEGAKTLYTRISRAAREVCPFEDAADLPRKVKNHACREAAIERAVSAINSTQLAAIRTEHVKRG
jgi:UrcA family protein